MKTIRWQDSFIVQRIKSEFWFQGQDVDGVICEVLASESVKICDCMWRHRRYILIDTHMQNHDSWRIRLWMSKMIWMSLSWKNLVVADNFQYLYKLGCFDFWFFEIKIEILNRKNFDVTIKLLTYRDQAGIHYLYSYSNCLTITVSMERTALTRKQAAKEQSKTAITYFESKWES